MLWAIIQVAAVVMVAYTVVMLSSVIIFRGKTVPVATLDLYRIGLKNFFWFSFAVFLMVEIIFTIHYAGFVFVGRLVRVGASRSDPVETWTVISVVIFMVVMAPYTAVFSVINRMFKRTALRIAHRVMNDGQTLEIISFKPKRLSPTEFFKEFVKHSPLALDYVRKSFGDKKLRFTVKSANQDLMAFTDAETRLEFWETTVSFEAEEKSIKRGKNEWREVYSKEFFNGICLRFVGVFQTPPKPQLIRIANTEEVADTPVREEQHYNAVAAFLTGLNSVFGTNTVLKKKGTQPEDYVGDPRVDELLGKNVKHLRYIGVNGRDVFLYIHTGLSGNLFEFSIKQTTARSIELFEQDLEFIRQRLVEGAGIWVELQQGARLAALAKAA